MTGLEMSGFLSKLNWATLQGSGPAKARAGSWTLERNSHRSEAQRHLKAGNLIDAERSLALAVQEADRRKLSASKQIRLRLDLAEVQRKQAALPGADPDGDWIAAAEHSARQAIQLAALVSDVAGYVRCLDVLTEIFVDKQNWPAVESTVKDAIRLAVNLPHPDPLRTARREHCLGIARHLNGRPEEALENLEKALEIHERTHGPEHKETGDILTEIGKVCRAQGQLERAEEYLRRAFRIHRAELGEAAAPVFDDIQQLAGTLEEMGDLQSAAEQYERALSIKERQIGVQNIDQLAEMQYSLSNLYAGWGNHSRARELLAECIGTFRRMGGARLAVAYETLAQVEENSGHHFSAIKELENAAKVWEACGPEKAIELVRNLEYRADLLEDLRKPREASWLREKAGERMAELRHAAAAAGLAT